MVLDEHFWITLSFIIFIALVFKKIKQISIAKLDAYTDSVKSKISEAEAMLNSAQSLFEDYKMQYNNMIDENALAIEQANNSAHKVLFDSKEKIEHVREIKLKVAREHLANHFSNEVTMLRSSVINNIFTMLYKIIYDKKSKINNKLIVESSISNIQKYKLHGNNL
jgi:F-type H+-transporting ATPase subunit b